MASKITGTVDEAAELIGVSRNTAYLGARSGDIPSIRIGKRIVVLWGPLMKKLGVEEDQVAEARAAEPQVA